MATKLHKQEKGYKSVAMQFNNRISSYPSWTKQHQTSKNQVMYVEKSSLWSHYIEAE